MAEGRGKAARGARSRRGPRIAVLGMGTMGRAIALGLLRAGEARRGEIVGTVRHAARAEEVARLVGVEVGLDSAAAAARAEVLLLCTKPHVTPGLLADLGEAGALDHAPLVVSIAAGVSTARLERAAGRRLRVVRVMPNTPCLVGEGMSVIAAGAHARAADARTAERLFRPLGRVMHLDEEHLDTVTGLSASGPAFVYVIIESLSEGGVMMGLPRRVATELAAQAVLGAARMVLETGRHPAELKDDVTTPAGCTISALLALEDGRLRSVLARGVEAAARAAAALAPPD
jgi:pyrroline-5-carboxylate reductase